MGQWLEKDRVYRQTAGGLKKRLEDLEKGIPEKTEIPDEIRNWALMDADRA